MRLGSAGPACPTLRPHPNPSPPRRGRRLLPVARVQRAACLPARRGAALRPGIGLALLRPRHGAVPPQARPGGPHRLRVRQKTPVGEIPTKSVRGLADKSSLAEKHTRPGSPSPAAPSRRGDPSSPPVAIAETGERTRTGRKEPRATRHPAQPTRPASPPLGRITGLMGRAGIRP